MIPDDDRSATPSTKNSAAVMLIDVSFGLAFFANASFRYR
jgi:hypothetical protein